MEFVRRSERLPFQVSVVIKRNVVERLVDVVGAVDGVEDDGAVLGGTGDGTEFVHGPTQRHGAGAADASISRAEPGDAAAFAGRNDGAVGFGAEGEGDEPGGGGGGGAGRGTTGALFGIPRVARQTAVPGVTHGKFAEAQLGDEHRAGGVEAFDDGGIFVDQLICVRGRAPGGGDAFGGEEVLDAVRNAGEQAAIFAGGDFTVHATSLLKCAIFRESDDAFDFRTIILEAIQAEACELLGSELAGLDEGGELLDGIEGEVVEVGREADARKRFGFEFAANGVELRSDGDGVEKDGGRDGVGKGEGVDGFEVL
jgi:hypothetical protein